MEETKTTENVQATETKKESYQSPYFMVSSDKIVNLDMSIAYVDSLIALLSKLSISKALGTVEALVKAIQGKLQQEPTEVSVNSDPKVEEDAKAV